MCAFCGEEKDVTETGRVHPRCRFTSMKITELLEGMRRKAIAERSRVEVKLVMEME